MRPSSAALAAHEDLSDVRQGNGPRSGGQKRSNLVGDAVPLVLGLARDNTDREGAINDAVLVDLLLVGNEEVLERGEQATGVTVECAPPHTGLVVGVAGPAVALDDPVETSLDGVVEVAAVPYEAEPATRSQHAVDLEQGAGTV